jgi:hypothetical protein
MNKIEGEQKTKQRLQVTLNGAFTGRPSQLKDIPTRTAETKNCSARSLSGACA